MRAAARKAGATIAVVLLAASCGGPAPSSTAAPTTSATVDAAVGGLHIATDPARLPVPLELGYIGAAADLGGVLDRVDADVGVSVSRLFVPGSIQIVANGVACDGTVDIAPDIEVDIQLSMKAGGACRAVIDFTHALGKVNHPIHGPIMGAVVPQGATVVFRSLDPLGTVAPVEVVAGPTGVEAMEFSPGRYEVTATLRGELLIKTEIDLQPAGDIVLDLMVVARSIPRDCGVVDPTSCEAAIAAAYSYGHWVRPDYTVSGVNVRPTQVTSCDPGIDPKLEVTFVIANDGGGKISATVGRLANGRWRACSPY